SRRSSIPLQSRNGPQTRTQYPDRVMAELLSGWGLTAPTASTVVPLTTSPDLTGAGPRGVVARGLGRSYGDAAQNAGGTVLDGTALDDLIQLDRSAATVRVSAGVSVDVLLRRIVPQGFFVPVTPGTRFVT